MLISHVLTLKLQWTYQEFQHRKFGHHGPAFADTHVL